MRVRPERAAWTGVDGWAIAAGTGIRTAPTSAAVPIICWRRAIIIISRESCLDENVAAHVSADNTRGRHEHLAVIHLQMQTLQRFAFVHANIHNRLSLECHSMD